MRQAKREEQLLEKEIEYFDLMANTRRLAKYNTTYEPWELRTTMNQPFVDKINRPLYEKFVRERPSYMKGLPNKYNIKIPGDMQLTSEEFDKTKSLTSAEFEHHRLEYNISLKELRDYRPENYDQWIPKHMRRIRKFMRKKKNETYANSTQMKELTHMHINHTETNHEKHTIHGRREKRQIANREPVGPNLVIYPKEYFDYLTDKLVQVMNDVEHVRKIHQMNMNEPSESYEQFDGEFDDQESPEQNEGRTNDINLFRNRICMIISKSTHSDEISKLSNNSPMTDDENFNNMNAQTNALQKKLKKINADTTDENLQSNNNSQDLLEKKSQEDGISEFKNCTDTGNDSLLLANESLNDLIDLINENVSQDGVKNIKYPKDMKDYNSRYKRQVIVMGNDTNNNLTQMGEALAKDIGEAEVLKWDKFTVRDYLRFRIKCHEQELINNASLVFAEKLKRLKEEEAQKTQNKTGGTGVRDEKVTEKQFNRNKRSVMNAGVRNFSENAVVEGIFLHRIKKRNQFESGVSLESNSSVHNNDTSEHDNCPNCVEKIAEVDSKTIDIDSTQHEQVSESNEQRKSIRFKRDINQTGYNQANLDIFLRVKGRREGIRHLRKELTEEKLADLLDQVNKTFKGNQKMETNQTKNTNSTDVTERSIYDFFKLKFNNEKKLILETDERKKLKSQEDMIKQTENPLFSVTIRRRKRLAQHLKYVKKVHILQENEIHKCEKIKYDDNLLSKIKYLGYLIRSHVHQVPRVSTI